MIQVEDLKAWRGYYDETNYFSTSLDTFINLQTCFLYMIARCSGACLVRMLVIDFTTGKCFFCLVVPSV